MPTASDGDQQTILLDTSTALALVIEDHELHEPVLAAVRGRPLGLAGHAWFETYSVLTRLPSGRRRSPADARAILVHNFPDSRFINAESTMRLIGELAARGISGGAVYDALVAAAAQQDGLDLLSNDSRARATYEAIGANVISIEH